MYRCYFMLSIEMSAVKSSSFTQCNKTLPVIFYSSHGGPSVKRLDTNMGWGRTNTFYSAALVKKFSSMSYATNLKPTKYSEPKYTKVCHRNSSNFVQRIRKQFTIKEHNRECVEALKSGRFLLYHTGNALMSKHDRFRPIWLSRGKVEEYLDNSIVDTQSAFLTLSDIEHNNLPLFALAVPKNMEEEKICEIETEQNGRFTPLRLAMLSGQGEGSYLSHGYSLLRWLYNTKYCSKCGSPAEKNISGSRVTCKNDKCGVIFYPPTSPVGIVLVASLNHSNVLLVRQPKYPVGMYSCVAGFVDMGETLYECVKREVAEEAGVEILPNENSAFKVLTSQHWPFPNGSLMTGCLALSPGPGELAVDVPKIDEHGEIENARWFEVQDIIDALIRINKNPMLRLTGADSEFKASDIFVPPQGAIAHQLLKIWLKEYHNYV